MDLEKRMRIYYMFLFAGFCIIFISASIDASLSNPFLWIGLAVYLVAEFWRFRYVRCPHCGSRMTYIRQLPECCPDCGKKLI